MKKRLLKFFFNCLWALLYASHSYAEPPDDFISAHLVTFFPPIQGDNHYPCQGIRVRPSVLFTSNACVSLISEQLNAGTPIEALDLHKAPLGKVKLLSGIDGEKGFLGLDTSKAYMNPGQRYPALHHKPLSRLSPAKAFYQSLSDGEIQKVVMVMLIYHKSDSQHHYIINVNEPLPTGAPIIHNGKVVCTVAPDGTCKAPVTDESTPDKIKQDCHDSLPGIYFYPGCVNRTITSCSEDLWELRGKGTCINSMSGETCTFSTDQQHDSETLIYGEDIACPSCSASYFEDIHYKDRPVITNTCTPEMCIKGCDSDSRSSAVTELINAMVSASSGKKAQESCDQCLAQEQQMFNNCLQICQAGFSYQACKDCSEAVTREGAYCQSICNAGAHPVNGQ